MNRAPRSAYAGVFFLALSIILFQIALTRVFSVMMWHHLTYMVVSIALLGFGAAGSILTARRDGERKDSPLGSLTTSTVGYGLSVIATFVVVRQVPINSLELWSDKTNLVSLLGLYLVVAVPFLLGGLAIGMALTRFVSQVNRLYFTDLVGSALGAAASVWLLAAFGGSPTVFIASALGLLGAFCFSLGAGKGHRKLAGLALAGGAVFCLASAGGTRALGLPGMDWHAPFAPGKEMRQYQDDPELVRLTSATAQVEVGPSHMTRPFLGGEFGIVGGRMVQGRWVGQDGTAPTMLFEGGGHLERFPFLRHSQTASAHVAMEARGGSDPDVLVIGVGGGVDVMVALAYDAAHVTAVELNTAMIDMVTEHYDDYLGGLFRDGAQPYSDRLELVNSEGRSYMRSREDRYDVIQMSGVDSFTALSTGAYTLSESYLYTTQAVQEFYEHLKPDGYINYSRFILTHPKKPRETLRLANIAYAALAELGVEDPASQIVVFQGQLWASTMIKRGAFTREEIDGLQAFAEQDGFLGVVFDPLRPAGRSFEPTMKPIAGTRQVRAQFARFASKLLPDEPKETAAAMAEDMRLAFIAYHDGPTEVMDAAVDRIAARFPSGSRDTIDLGVRKHLTSDPVPMAEAWSVGLAASRRDFDELLRGSPGERQAFIDTYEYDISSCTDDRPFFFNYYRYSQLFDASDDNANETSQTSLYHPDFPVGHMVLLASMVQIVLLAAVLIFLPLRGLAKRGLRTAGSWRYFAYFAALGMGFMFIEIVLMQKMVIFLGHPTYAVSVVLASLLGAAGLGSLLAGRIRVLSRANLMRILLGIVVMVAFVTLFMNYGLPGLLGESLGVRMAVVVAMITPLGILLGMPFPTGMRIVEQRAPHLLPWAWAINGFLSVFSSVFCIVMSMFVGFTSMLGVAAAVYALGFLLMRSADSAGTAGDARDGGEAARA